MLISSCVSHSLLNEERIRKKRPVEIFGKDLDFYQGCGSVTPSDYAPNSRELLPGNGEYGT